MLRQKCPRSCPYRCLHLSNAMTAIKKNYRRCLTKVCLWMSERLLTRTNMAHQMSPYSTTSSYALKTNMTSKHDRRSRSSTRTMRFLQNTVFTQVMTVRVCASCSNWLDPIPTRKPPYTRNLSSCSRAQASHWTTEMKISPLRLARGQCCMKRKVLQKTVEQRPGKHHQSVLKGGIPLPRCTMSRLRLGDSQNEGPYLAPQSHTCSLKNRLLTGDLRQNKVHRDLHAGLHIPAMITLRRLKDPWKDLGWVDMKNNIRVHEEATKAKLWPKTNTISTTRPRNRRAY
jgi:hypothetical protein